MKWHEWQTMHQKESRITRDSIREWTAQNAENDKYEFGEQSLIKAEYAWSTDRKPYYSLWPTIADGLISASLDIDSKFASLPSGTPTILVRLPIGHELQISPALKLASMLVSTGIHILNDSEQYVRFLGMWMSAIDEAGQWLHGEHMLPVYDGNTIEWCLGAERRRTKRSSEQHDDATATCLRLLCAICLLDESSGMLVPDVLTDDQEKFDSNPESRERLIDRAKRRGKFGWTVGKNLEVSPHIRRPHFGIRWTEAGRTVPKLVPIKGSVVKRKTIYEVPTGYLDPL